MIPWMLGLLAWGGPPIDMADTTRWLDAPEALRDGPPGCWEVVGEARWNHDFGSWGATRGTSVFVAEWRDGVWGELSMAPAAEVVRGPREGEERPLHYAPEAVRFVPLVGRVRGLSVGLDEDRALMVRRSLDTRIEPVNTLTDVLEKTGSVSASWARWEDGAVVVREAGDRGGNDAVVVRTVFPGGLVPATQVLVALDGSYRHDLLGLVRVTQLDVELRGRLVRDGLVLPTSERMQVELKLLGRTVRAAQTIRYRRVAPCVENPGVAPAAPRG
jgi:hypothetical protein